MNVVVALTGSSAGQAPVVGDIVHFEVFLDEKVGSPGDGWEVDAPPGTNWLPAGSVTVSVASVRTRPAEGNVTKLELEALVHQPGPLVVGPLRLRDQVTKAEVSVPPTAVEKMQVSAGTKPAQEPPWILGPVRFGGWDWVTVGIAGAALAIVAILLGRFLWRRLQRHLHRQLTFTERALHELANLQKYMRSNQPLPQEEWKKFSFELAGALRRYCDENFRMSTGDRTDREFLEELRAHPTAGQHVHVLAQILGTITEVRYGRKALNASVIPGLLLDSRKFVDQTTTQRKAEAAKK